MVPATLLTACDLAELPADTASVEIYDARTGDWSRGVGADLEAGDTFVESGRVLHLNDAGVEVRGEATTTLAEADATWVAEAAHRLPSGEDWVLVLGDRDDAGHWLLSEVEAGERFAFQGRVFDTADEDADGDLEVWATAAVVAEVQRTHVRDSKVLIDLLVSADGGSELITGTPEHPFWVGALGDYVPLAELEVGTVLRTAGGGDARVVSMVWREGGEDVFNFEVEGVQNYFVRAPGSDSAGVLVHNGCGKTGGARFIGEPNGTLVDTHATPPGSYSQPGRQVANGEAVPRTDVLQPSGDHGAGMSHTHQPKINSNSKTGDEYVQGLDGGQPVTAAEVQNITDGTAVPAPPKGR